MYTHWPNILISYIAITIFTHLMIKNKFLIKETKVFFISFLFTQLIAFVFDINYLYINVPHGDSGTMIQTVAIIIPSTISFASHCIFKLLERNNY